MPVPRKVLILALAVCFPLAAQEPLRDLDSFVAEAMRTFEVPGIAVAVVKNGEVALAKGYGVRKMGELAPVDARTLFGIGSNTKAFTAAALGILVDEGKIAWDDPVTQRMPGFQMYDPYVTREITVRDLLTHRAVLGLGAGDLLFWPPTTFSRDEIVQPALHQAGAQHAQQIRVQQPDVRGRRADYPGGCRRLLGRLREAADLRAAGDEFH